MNIDIRKQPLNLFTKALSKIGFQQLVQSPTHILGGILDHVYVYCVDSTKFTLYKTHPLYYSDHDAVTILVHIGDPVR